SVMLRMLDALGAEDGHRVLELGTGTGYNAALLAHRVGASEVTSIDIDYELVKEAVRHLDAVGLRPTVVVGDGAQGWPSRAPYDRIAATVGVLTMPRSLRPRPDAGQAIGVPAGYGSAGVTVTGRGDAVRRFLAIPAFLRPRRGSRAPRRFHEADRRSP